MKSLRSKYGSPVVRKIGEQLWEVTEDWWTPYGVVTKGTKTNGASIPWWLQWLIKPDGVLFAAAVYHDWCYQNAIISKLYADNCFKQINKDKGVNKFLIHTSYLAVKHFGKGNY